VTITASSRTSASCISPHHLPLIYHQITFPRDNLKCHLFALEVLRYPTVHHIKKILLYLTLKTSIPDFNLHLYSHVSLLLASVLFSSQLSQTNGTPTVCVFCFCYRPTQTAPSLFHQILLSSKPTSLIPAPVGPPCSPFLLIYSISLKHWESIFFLVVMGFELRT
jgi:hypothetical protein